MDLQIFMDGDPERIFLQKGFVGKGRVDIVKSSG
jgi:hypothetical protein